MTMPIRTAVLVCLLAPTFVGCGSLPSDVAAPPSPTEATIADAVAVVGADAPQEPAASAPAAGNAEPAIWNDPSFKKRFRDSYIAETEIEPGVADAEREQLLEALELITADKLDEALRLLQSLRSDTASAVVDFTLAGVHYQKDEFEQAAGAYEVAVGKHPKFRRAWQMLAEIRYRRGELIQAARAFTRVIEFGGGDAVTYGLLGSTLARQGNHVGAESAFRTAAMMAPERLDWKVGLAQSFFAQGRFADAVALFDTLIAEQPDRAEFWMEQGKAYARLGQPLKAAQNFEMVDRLGGSMAASLGNLGDIYANQELFDLAADAHLRALRLQPDASERAVRAAKYLSAHSALAELRTLVDGIESICGERLAAADRKELLKLRARLAVAEGADAEGARVLHEIVNLDPLDGDALILLGQHYGRTGDEQKAMFYFERAAGMESFEADAKLRHGELLVRKGDYAQALPLLRSAQALKPREHVQKFVDQIERAAQKR